MISNVDKLVYGLFALWTTILLQSLSKRKFRRNNHNLRKKNIINLSIYTIAFIFLFASIIIFCAYREIGIGQGGTDAYTYMQQFMSSNGTFRQQMALFSGWEPLYVISMWLVRQFTSNYRIFLVLYYIVMTFCLLKYSSIFQLDKKSFISTFAIMLLFLESFNTQRNTLAVFLGFFIIHAIQNKKYGKAFLVALIATGIHFSAAIYFFIIFAFYCIHYFKGSRRRILSIYVGFSLVFAIIISNLVPIIVRGHRLSVYSPGLNVSYAMIVGYICILILYVIHRKTIDKDETIQNLVTLYITFAPMFVFQLYYAIMYRTMLYSIPIYYILIWQLKKMFTQQGLSVSRFMKYILLDAMILLRILPFFVSSFSDLGSYSNMLF